MSQNYKLLVPHVEGCLALRNVEEGAWDTPWWYPGEVRHLDALGRRTRYALGPRRWHVLRCNTVQNPELEGGCCPAEAIVRESVLFEAVPSDG